MSDIAHGDIMMMCIMDHCSKEKMVNAIKDSGLTAAQLSSIFPKTDDNSNTCLVNGVMSHEYGAIAGLLDFGIDMEVPCGQSRSTALHVACDQVDREKSVQMLLEHGAKVDALDYYGQTPLANAASDDGTIVAVKLLLDHGAAINYQNLHSEFGSNTALHRAANGAAPAVVKLLLERGADATLVNSDGKTALQLAEDDVAERMAEEGWKPKDLKEPKACVKLLQSPPKSAGKKAAVAGKTATPTKTAKATASKPGAKAAKAAPGAAAPKKAAKKAAVAPAKKGGKKK